MADQFRDLNAAMRMRESFKKIAEGVVHRIYPPPRFATVQSTDTTGRTAVVQYVDETGTNITVKCSTLMPMEAGSVVRVNGPSGGRFIDQVIDGKVRLTNLNLSGSPDVDASGNGSLRIGEYGTTAALHMDGNEMQAFDAAGAAGQLNAQLEGGLFQVGAGGINTTGRVDATLNIESVGDIVAQGEIVTDNIRARTSQQMIIAAGESFDQINGQVAAEKVYLAAEGGIEIHSSPDNWGSLWAGRDTITINPSGNGGAGQLLFPTTSGTKIQLYSTSYTLGVSSSTMDFVSTRYFEFTESGDATGVIRFDMNGNPKITIENDTDSDYIEFYADTTWSRIHANQAIYINQIIHPNGGVRAYSNGTSTAPVFSFYNDTNTGFYSSGNNAGTIYGSTNGTLSFRIASASFYARGVWYTDGGTSGYPVRVINSSGQLAFQSSSRAVKRDIESMELAYAEKVLDLEPVFYRYRNTPEASHFGLIAEDVAAVEPRWALFRNEDEDTCTCDFSELVGEGKRYAERGVVPPLVHEPGCRSAVSVDYGQLTVPLILLAQDHRSRLVDLEARLAALEAAA